MKIFQPLILIFLTFISITTYAQNSTFRIKEQNGVNVYQHIKSAQLVDILLKPWWQSMRELINHNEYQTCDSNIQFVPNIFFTNKSNLYYAKFKELFILNASKAYTAWEEKDVPRFLNYIGEMPIEGLKLAKNHNRISLNRAHPFHNRNVLTSDFNGDIKQYSATITEEFETLIDQYKAFLTNSEKEEDSEKIPDHRCTSSISFVLTEKRTQEYGIGFDIQILHHWYNPLYDRVLVKKFDYLDIPLTDFVRGKINSTYIITSLYKNKGKITCSVNSKIKEKEKYRLEFTTKLREKKANDLGALQGAELFEYLHKEDYFYDFYQFQLSVNGKSYELNHDGFSFNGLDKGEEGARIYKTWKINQDGRVPVNLYKLETKDGFFRNAPPQIVTESKSKAKENYDPYISKKENFRPLSILVKKPSNKRSLFEEMNVTNCYLEF